MQRRELETAAANYSYLRGLLYIPVGGLLVLSALGNWQVGPFRHPWVFLLVALVIAAVAVSSTASTTSATAASPPRPRSRSARASRSSSRWR